MFYYNNSQTSTSGILYHFDDKLIKTSPEEFRADNNVGSLDKCASTRNSIWQKSTDTNV